MNINRRQSCYLLGSAVASTCLQPLLRDAISAETNPPHIATNTYPWRTFAKRAGQTFARHSDSLLADISKTGIAGYEPIIDSPTELAGLADKLRKHELEMRSIYVNSVLHDANTSGKSIDTVLAIAAAARDLGTKIIVTNPSPIRWGGKEDKSDAQLRRQAKSLDRLGAELKKSGTTLAYHNHDAELRQGGREFHHMLTATDPEHVKFCLDAHWIFRGCGDSEVAVFDALTLYQKRIVELHLRQSNGGVWTEAYSPEGDIDYSQILSFLMERGTTPHLVLEQAVEERTPQQLTVVEAHTRGRSRLAKLLG